MGKVDAKRIAKRLDEVFANAHVETVALEDARIVVFSDQHRGKGDGADDFKKCKRAYHAALGHYLEARYRLCVLGDVEELWECFAGPVVKTYADTLALEGEFNRVQGRYLRVVGNHDDIWARPSKVNRYLGPVLGDLQVHEGVRLQVTQRGQGLGTLFMVHGHQGTFESEKASVISRLFVRYIWRNWQRLTHMRINSPAKDFELRQEHERAMYGWAEGKPKTVLVAGHTHRPVFQSLANAAQLEQQLSAARADLAANPGDAALLDKVTSLRAQVEWAKAADGAHSGEPDPKACYFNTGCCCFDDGDVTGIEIADGEIRLVRWPDDAGEPKPQVLARAGLAEVFGL